MSANTLRIGFAGTPDIARQLLSELLSSGTCEVALILTKPDKPKGRQRKLQASPVAAFAKEHHIRVYQPATANQISVDCLQDLDLLIVFAYGLLLPPAVLSAPRLGCLNVHFSLLPRWRGASPVQHALLAGDTETGFTLMQMDSGMDSGPIYLQESCPVSTTDTCTSLMQKLLRKSTVALLQYLKQLQMDFSLPEPEPQNSSGISYAPVIRKEDCWIDWQQDCLSIDRQVRALYSSPIARTRTDRGNWNPLKIWQVQADPEHHTNASYGTILRCDQDGILVQCGEGAIAIKKLQSSGKRPLAVADWLNGCQDFTNRCGNHFTTIPS